MKVTTVSLSRTIPTGAYENVKIGMEGTLEGEESPFDALDKLKRLIDAWHINEFPPKENEITGSDLPPHLKTEVTFSNRQPKTTPTIDYKAIQSLEIQIDNATTLEELSEIKEAAFKAGLTPQYIKKANELVLVK